MAGRGGIDALLDLMDEAFRGAGIEESNESQALLPNLATVTPDQWRALPTGAARSIADIANHVGACKIMYDDYAFDGGTLQFATPEVEPFATEGSPGSGRRVAAGGPRAAGRPRRRPRRRRRA